MIFKASKKRERKAAEPVGRGTQIIPSAAIARSYEKKIQTLANEMIADYRREVNSSLDDSVVKKFFAEDAQANSVLSKTLERLKNKWKNIFSGFAREAAKSFVDKCAEQADVATLFSLSTAGIKEPRATYNDAVANILGAAVDYNHTLITNIQEDVHEKIYSSVMLSLTSPNPEQQGMAGIESALKEVGGFSKKRIKLISSDQTSKLYSSLSDERMEENGVEEFEWAHSSAGKVPRHTHVEKDGKIFKLNDPRLWEGPKADQGPPGWAINCRCRKIPII